jgi:hypothetical protein
LIIDKELGIEDAPEAYKEFSDHNFIQSVIRFDDFEKEVLLKKNKARRRHQLRRSRRETEHMIERKGAFFRERKMGRILGWRGGCLLCRCVKDINDIVN